MYTVDYFINKFEAIPSELFNVGSQYKEDGTRCALGWCDTGCALGWCDTGYYQERNEQEHLISLFEDVNVFIIKNVSGNNYEVGEKPEDINIVAAINNGETAQYQQSTPKQRILAALYDIKKMQQPLYQDLTEQLAVLPTEETVDVVREVVLLK